MGSFSNLFQRVIRSLFGDLRWSPPAWCRWLGAHGKFSALGFVVLLALGFGGWRLADWWQHRPLPQQIGVEVESIAVTRLEEELHPDALRIDFSRSAAPLEGIGKPVSKGITLDPSPSGEWRWSSDRQLTFSPKQDWPAGQRYRIRLLPGLVRADVPLARDRLEVTTPELSANIQEFTFYQDPKDPAIRQVVATLSFTHPITRGELEAHANLEMLGKSDLFPTGAPRFTITYGLHDRLVYLRSAPLKLPPAEDFARLTLPIGLRTTLGAGRTREEVVDKVKVPDLNSFFRIDSIAGSIVNKKDGEPEQVLIVATTAAVKPESIAGAIELRLLPERPDHKRWGGPREITEEVLARSTVVPLTLIPQARPVSQLVSFRIKLEQSGQLYARIKPGIEALGGYPLSKAYDTVLGVPEPARSLGFQGEGGLLALAGEHKLSVKSRGLPGIRYEIARVRADQINHLVSQTEGRFQAPEFLSSNFDEENISRLAEEKQAIAMRSRFEANYTAFDFSKYLAKPTDGGSECGLFFLRAQSWDPKNDHADDPQTSARFVLVTDLGLLAKFNSDGTASIFVMSLKGGAPAAGVQVELLGKNGVPLVNATTAEDGCALFPKLTDERREKEPVAIVARLGDDVSFLPYKRDDRELDFSRFDIGGVSNVDPAALDAFAFTERGIYRPGDTVHLAWAVKQRNWTGDLTGLPLEIQVTDSRGKAALVKRLSLPKEAFSTLDFATQYESPAGQYALEIYLVKNGWRDIQLGTANFVVKEFLPDRMKLETKLSKPGDKGWITPDDLSALLTLRNLYGTPASDRRIKSTLTLSPTDFSFDAFPGYTFYDRLLDQKKTPKTQNIELAEQKTDADGTAKIDFDLDQYAKSTWRLSYYAEAFEGNSGRCVTGQASAIVSAQPYLIGSKADGDLNFIQVGAGRIVSFVAVDSTLGHVTPEKLEGRLIEQAQISMLVKKPNGNYAYESVEQDKELRREPAVFSGDGFTWKVPSAEPGSFLYELWNAQGERVARIGFQVVGAGEVDRARDRNAELKIQLDKPEYNAGDTLQVSIHAPYTGSGLITIESNHVHAHTWFHAETASSVQQITLPPDFEGTGYVSVSFVRALDSPEIFSSPLSYGVVPFKANFAKRRVNIALGLPTLTKPGEPLAIHYHADRPTKIVLFAVDKGILQVTDYKTPDPLEWFFRKTALETRTTQIVDLLIPEFSLLRQLSAPGGGEDAKLNPFRRVTEKPVVYWSGIVDADATDRTVTYNVPDYFSGTLQVMAVAISADATGSAEVPVTVRGPFVITPGVPTAVAPGDEFEAGVTVANSRAGSGAEAVVKLEVQPSPQLEILGPSAIDLKIAEGAEASTSVRVRVKEKLGAAGLVFIASNGGESSKLGATLSVRPATPFMVELRTQNFRKSRAEQALLGGWHEEFRQGVATVSAVPLGLARGLDFYLQNFPYGCSEQITSGAFARLVLADEADFGLTRALVQEQMNRVYETQRRRQAGNGGFGYWTSDAAGGADFITIYVLHFLIEAKAAGFHPPQDMLGSGLGRLRQIAGMNPSSLDEARNIAYAIYLLTREEVVTTNYVLNLQDTLNRRFARRWKSDLTSAYLAATWKLLKKEGDAEQLIDSYRLGSVAKNECSSFYDEFSADSRYLALLARHFPERLRKVSAGDFSRYLAPIGEGRYSTLSAAYAVLALKSYAQLVAVDPLQWSVRAGEQSLALEGKLVQRAAIPPDAMKLLFQATGKMPPLGFFAQTMEAGFQIAPPKAVVNDGMEVFHELLDERGAPVSRVKLGTPVTVRIVARAKDDKLIENVAVIDLVPGGFEVVPDSIKPGRSDLDGVDFVEVREDRVVLFGSLRSDTREWKYQLRPVSKGRFVVPPAFAESMYDRRLKSHGIAGQIEVVQP